LDLKKGAPSILYTILTLKALGRIEAICLYLSQTKRTGKVMDYNNAVVSAAAYFTSFLLKNPFHKVILGAVLFAII
jgi:hypothetical protein